MNYGDWDGKVRDSKLHTKEEIVKWLEDRIEREKTRVYIDPTMYITKELYDALRKSCDDR